jgi:hypothetical protein
MKKSSFKDPDNLFGKSTLPQSAIIKESRCMILSSDDLSRMNNKKEKINFNINNNNHSDDETLLSFKIQERKETMKRMQALQFDDHDKQFSIDQESRNKKILHDSASKRLNGTDIVKQLNTIASRATAFTMRSKQLEEKKQREEKEIEYNERMNLIMEIKLMFKIFLNF